MTHSHRYGVMEHVSNGGAFAQERVGAMESYLYSQGMNIEKAHAVATKVLDDQVTRQSYAMATNDVFILTSILFAFMLPLIFLIKRARAEGGSPGVH